jgi:preprotein translocase subunit SecF
MDNTRETLDATVTAGDAAPITPLQTKASTRHHSVLSRLSTGTGAFNIIGHRRKYYFFSSALLVLSIVFMIVRGFNLSIDFVGGTQLTFRADQAVSHSQVTSVLHDAIGVETESVVDVGVNTQVSMPSLDATQVTEAKHALAAAFPLTGDVSDSAVSGTWGSEISTQALISVIVFLIAVALFITIRYEHRVAIGAVLSVLHDLVVAAGIYALIGFEVAPATIIGLLTILGFSLYDTVVVYDKVEENVKGLTSLLRRTYPEAANLAINQTLMRSINTSLIALLPVAGLLTAGVAILGSGTLKDLSLVMLCGMLIGAYSSVFLAVPLAVDLKMREPAIRNHTRRVEAKRRAEGLLVDADGDPIGRVPVTDATGAVVAAQHHTSYPGVQAEPASPLLRPGSGPLPGVKPVRPSGKSVRTGGTPQPTGKRHR